MLKFIKNQDIAIKYGKQFITYEKLGEKIDTISAIIRNNFSNHSVIWIDAHKSLNTIIMILSCINAWITYCPIDFSLPPERVTSMIDSLKLRFIFSDRDITKQDMYPSINFLSTIELEKLDSWNPCESSTNNIAYIMFTSGSTGTPKGIKVSRSTLSNLIEWHTNTYYKDSTLCRNTLQYAPLYFDVSIQEILTTITTNWTLIIYDEEKRNDPFYLSNVVTTEKIHNLFFPYTAIRLLAGIMGISFEDVNYIFTAWEKVKITTEVRDFFRRNKHIQLVNQYWPTETHVITAHTLWQYNDHWDIFPPIWKPIQWIIAKICVNEKLYDVAPHLVGELCVSWNSLFAWYLDETLNEKTLVSDSRGLLFYKTWDLVKINENGDLMYIDRNDNTIKLRGFRIELDEIERSILCLKDIKECFVLYNKEQEIIELYYIWSRNKEEMISHISHSLPSYMIPQKIIQLEIFPLTSTWKIDKSQLWKSHTTHMQKFRENTQEHSTKNENNLWELVREIFIEILPAGVDFWNEDSFFSIGGDSLRLMELYKQLTDKYHYNIPFDALLTHLTINSLLRIIEDHE